MIHQFGLEHVVVRMYQPGERPPRQHSLDQVRSARKSGAGVGAYCWPYEDIMPILSVRNVLSLMRRARLWTKVLWFDVEEGAVTDEDWLLAAFDRCLSEPGGPIPGIYTRRGFWVTYLRNTERFSRFPLWAADYNNIPDLDSVELFGGWSREMLWGHQYAVVDVPGRPGFKLDLDVFSSEVV